MEKTQIKIPYILFPIPVCVPRIVGLAPESVTNWVRDVLTNIYISCIVMPY